MSALTYLAGFGNHHASEASVGALPPHQNSPQHAAFGLYAEQLSGSAFTAPRADNLRAWLYRLKPSAAHPAMVQIDHGRIRTAPCHEAITPPHRLRWNPLQAPTAPTDFMDGLVTIATNGDAKMQQGMAVHLYAANAPMTRAFGNADGEFLIVPQQGALTIVTEFGILGVVPGEIALMPRGVKFRVACEGPVRGYVCENYGTPLRLPELGPIGANGLAAARDFQYPVAWFETITTKTILVTKFCGNLWQTEIEGSPFDVVAWHGNYAPYKYNLAHFQAINTVSFDHCDPSIFTVLTSPSATAGVANVDFVIFPPRWLVAEHTFRPPWFHRNIMSEYMGLIHGVYDAKAEGFMPGGGSLHNCFTAHGPDAATYSKAINEIATPRYLDNTLAFMFESRYVLAPTAAALAAPFLQAHYDAAWQGFQTAKGTA